MAKVTKKSVKEVETVETVKTSRRGRKAATAKKETMTAEVGMKIVESAYEKLSELRFNEMCNFLLNKGHIKLDDLKDKKSTIYKIKKRWIDLVTTIEGGIDTNKKYDALKKLIVEQFGLNVFEDLLFSKSDYLHQFSWLIVKSTQFCVRYSLDRTALLKYFTLFGWDKISVFITSENWIIEVKNREEKFIAEFPDSFTEVEPTPEDPYTNLKEDDYDARIIEAILHSFVLGYADVNVTAERLQDFGYDEEGAYYIIDTFAEDIYQEITPFLDWLFSDEVEEEEEELEYSITDETEKSSKRKSKKVVEEETEEEDFPILLDKNKNILFGVEQGAFIEEAVTVGTDYDSFTEAGMNIIAKQEATLYYILNYVAYEQDVNEVFDALSKTFIKKRKVCINEELIKDFKTPRGFKSNFAEAVSAKRKNTRINNLEALLLETGFNYEVTEELVDIYTQEEIDYSEFLEIINDKELSMITVLGSKVIF